MFRHESWVVAMLHLCRWFLLPLWYQTFFSKNISQHWGMKYLLVSSLDRLHVMLIDFYCRHNWAKIRFPGEFVSKIFSSCSEENITTRDHPGVNRFKYFWWKVYANGNCGHFVCCNCICLWTQKWSLHFIRFMMYLIDILKCSGPYWTNDPAFSWTIFITSMICKAWRIYMKTLFDQHHQS